VQAGDRLRATDQPDVVSSRSRATVWSAAVWLLAIVALSVTASLRPHLVLQWSRLFPGRDKTGHFILMGGFAAMSVIAFAGRRVGARRIPVVAVLAAVVAVVVLEEFVQLWLPNRTFSMVDLAWSLAGVACFGALAAAWCARRDRRHSR
jgi:VanZ family protein